MQNPLNRNFLLALAVCAGSLAAADKDIWKVAPPPPASWEAGRVADLAARRKAMAEQIGPKGILILYAAEPRNYAGDVDWPYRQENDFFYLTGLTQPGATLVLAPGAAKMREMVFIPRPVQAQETWTGHMITAAEARETSGVLEIFEAGQFNGFFGTPPEARLAILRRIPGTNPPRYNLRRQGAVKVLTPYLGQTVKFGSSLKV